MVESTVAKIGGGIFANGAIYPRLLFIFLIMLHPITKAIKNFMYRMEPLRRRPLDMCQSLEMEKLLLGMPTSHISRDELIKGTATAGLVIQQFPHPAAKVIGGGLSAASALMATDQVGLASAGMGVASAFPQFSAPVQYGLGAVSNLGSGYSVADTYQNHYNN